MNHRCRDNRLQRATSMILIGMLLVLSSAVTVLAQVAVDPALQPYEKGSGVSGNLDSIFSSTNKRGGKPFNTWGELGLTGEWANRPLSLYGRNSASGTYGFFK